MSTLRFHTLDVFTDQAFGGNPLAVVLGGDALSTEQMQRIAREFNLSETVFVLPARQAEAMLRLRIFTPYEELPFAGHPNVGAACLLAMRDLTPRGDEVSFTLEQGIGLVKLRVQQAVSSTPYAELTAPQAPTFGPAPAASTIAAMLGLSENDFSAGGPAVVSCGLPMLLVPLRAPDLLAGITTDFARLPLLLQSCAAHSVYVYALGYEGGADTVPAERCVREAPHRPASAPASLRSVTVMRAELRARMFSPGIGEDPATGSAAAALAARLANDAPSLDGTLQWVVHQGEEMGRPSRLFISADKIGGRIAAVRVGGHAVSVMEGHLHAL